MSDKAIIVENLSKRYRIGLKEEMHETLGGAIGAWLKEPFANFRRLKALTQFETDSGNLSDVIWALKDVSFEVKQGEVVGIIGANGAGKSTLLKIISRIVEPTSGRALLNGRVASLLEVGTGFHPELTGRENIYLNGVILGMSKTEIDRKFDEIVAFSGVEKFLDTPVKRYSSGMGVRLAFAVAAHLEPEILLIDEVLAVGDASFQRKCLGKMEDITNQGRTVLFVSHNMAAVRQLCQRGIVLNSGMISYTGAMSDCVNHYLSGGRDKEEIISIISHTKKVHPGMDITSIQINGSELDQVALPSNAKLLTIMISGKLDEPMRMEMEALISDSNETPLGFFSPGHEKGEVAVYPAGNFELVRNIELPRMMSGEYYISLFLTDPGFMTWFRMPHAARLIAEGTTTSTGLVFEYRKGAGWLFLSETED